MVLTVLTKFLITDKVGYFRLKSGIKLYLAA